MLRHSRSIVKVVPRRPRGVHPAAKRVNAVGARPDGEIDERADGPGVARARSALRRCGGYVDKSLAATMVPLASELARMRRESGARYGGSEFKHRLSARGARERVASGRGVLAT